LPALPAGSQEKTDTKKTAKQKARPYRLFMGLM